MTANAEADHVTARPRLRLDRFRGRPFLLAIAALNAITGAAAAAVLAPLTLGSDVEIFRRGAQGVAQGLMARDFFYAPLFGFLAAPLAWLPLEAAELLVGLAGLTVVLVGAALETRGRETIDRILIAIAAACFLPVVYELLIGQVTLFLAATVYPFRDRDGWRRGIAFGFVLGLIPKPMLVPLLLWMLVFRRRALGAALGIAALVTMTGLVLLGPGLYRGWLAALVGTGQITRHGNLALNALNPSWLAAALWLLTGAIGLWVIARRESVGFVAALVVALLVQPFTLAYAVSILLLAVRPAALAMPRATRWMSLAANPAVLGPFAVWMLAALAACAVSARGTHRPPTSRSSPD